MGFARCQVEWNNDTLQPVDRAVNVWHFQTPGAVADVADEITALLDTFYTAIDEYFSPALTGTGVVKFYDLEDPQPRAPVAEVGISMAALGSTGYPNEVALCMSFQGVIASGANQARRRGRIFLGPLSTSIGGAQTGDVRPSSTARTNICAAADALMSDATTPGLIWSVFSPSTAGSPPWSAGTLGDSFVTVTNGWVNDAFDTMRSRGLAPTTRTVW